MPKYDVEHFDPPAPVATVTLRHPVTGASLSDVPMLIETGADDGDDFILHELTYDFEQM